ncbi:hypothetical protein SARC_01203 [Sphaeroforma arctica JP610]|uniref:Nascent polypeptide-associated complex subunit beta n=1 Tax=Sphaeroforma arctica JP610 TaxID=667725 RepID=A0A0L0GCQ4_9EUKA|nr:hypothetical protein SARC_01203 [Sphaeroforma arctica JP610]KNC86666.1 hypothetical protein SARC_01203 [Sphaeroforma arctica JP610]|eukprot:XP_014160568.1 hypothetical protein SARC_01203 [Sphaeroforma arctica JP610]
MNPEKLAKLQNTVRTGGKGTVRRKKKVVHKSGAQDDKKIQAILKKLQVNPLPGFTEVNMFKEDGTILHFDQPKVQANFPSKTFAISGKAETKQIQELLPGILQQMGPEALASINQMAQQMRAQQQAQAAAGGAQDDDVPDLVDSFDQSQD